MTVWIDTPAWPHRGQLFAHMVSDAALEELHDVAERAGVHPRAFDRDHYDVPEVLLTACLDAGAVPAHTRRLVRALRESGLRLTKAQAKSDRDARRGRLWKRWPLACVPSLADVLLDRWSARGRSYHDPRHLEHCLDALDLLGSPGQSDEVVVLAVWFHDAVYEGRAGADEEASAVFAEESLDGLLSPAAVAEVARLVRLTAGHEVADGDVRGALLCDADLANLGAPAEAYARYCRDVRLEYADVPLVDFRRGRLEVVQHLFGMDPLYRTVRGQEFWAASARVNLAAEADRLAADIETG